MPTPSVSASPAVGAGEPRPAVSASPAAGVRLDWALGEPETHDGAAWRTLTVTATAETAWEGRLRAEFSFPAQDPWWLIPGLFYGDNRPEGQRRLYPRYQAGAEDAATLTSSHWSFRADRAATPVVFAWGDGQAWGLAADHATAAGLTGLGFAGGHGLATLHLDFPYAEAPWTYYGDAEPRPPLAATLALGAGQSVTLTARLIRLAPDRHAYAPVLRALHAEAVPANPLSPWVSVEEAAGLTAYGLRRWHFDPDPGVLLETAAFDRCLPSVDRQAMHIAWVSGIPWAFALLRHGRRTGQADETGAAIQVLDFCADAISPSGFFWGTWYRGRGWRGAWTEEKDAVHARTLGEATLFLLRAWLAEQARGIAHPAWEAAVRSNLLSALAVQRQDGSFGALYDAHTGSVLRWDGAAGLMWIPALVEAAEHWPDQSTPDESRPGGSTPGVSGAQRAEWLAAAARAGEFYAQFTDREFIHGAPEDVDLAPTSEDGFNAVMAYTALARATGAARWLDLARRSADWMLTFRYSYNVSFEPETLLGDYRCATRGADQASVSNQHLGNYGLICLRELRALSAALGDPHYAERADEQLAAFRQFVARRDGDFNAMKGMQSERYYQTECFAPKGSLLTLSHAWCLGATLLACEDVLEGQA
jgi:hypothetical protein